MDRPTSAPTWRSATKETEGGSDTQEDAVAWDIPVLAPPLPQPDGAATLRVPSSAPGNTREGVGGASGVGGGFSAGASGGRLVVGRTTGNQNRGPRNRAASLGAMSAAPPPAPAPAVHSSVVTQSAASLAWPSPTPAAAAAAAAQAELQPSPQSSSQHPELELCAVGLPVRVSSSREVRAGGAGGERAGGPEGGHGGGAGSSSSGGGGGSWHAESRRLNAWNSQHHPPPARKPSLPPEARASVSVAKSLLTGAHGPKASGGGGGGVSSRAAGAGGVQRAAAQEGIQQVVDAGAAGKDSATEALRQRPASSKTAAALATPKSTMGRLRRAISNDGDADYHHTAGSEGGGGGAVAGIPPRVSPGRGRDGDHKTGKVGEGTGIDRHESSQPPPHAAAASLAAPSPATRSGSTVGKIHAGGAPGAAGTGTAAAAAGSGATKLKKRPSASSGGGGRKAGPANPSSSRRASGANKAAASKTAAGGKQGKRGSATKVSQPSPHSDGSDAASVAGGAIPALAPGAAAAEAAGAGGLALWRQAPDLSIILEESGSTSGSRSGSVPVPAVPTPAHHLTPAAGPEEGAGGGGEGLAAAAATAHVGGMITPSGGALSTPAAAGAPETPLVAAVVAAAAQKRARAAPKELDAASFQLSRILGSGSFATVYLAKHLETRGRVVVKRLDRRPTSHGAQTEVDNNEVAVLTRAGFHPNLVDFRGWYRDPRDGVVCLVMGYCGGGTLAQLIKNPPMSEAGVRSPGGGGVETPGAFGTIVSPGAAAGGAGADLSVSEANALAAAAVQRASYFPEDLIMFWFVQLLLALHHLHGRKIMHRDLKPENIFMAANRRVVKLGDLGVAKQLEGTFELAITCLGTPYYMSPECLASRPYTYMSDIWSLGCVLYEMAARRTAFEALGLPQLMFKILRVAYDPLPPQFSRPFQQLVNCMLRADPDDRPTTQDLLSQPFVRRHLKRLLDISGRKTATPADRPSAMPPMVKPSEARSAVKRLERASVAVGAAGKRRRGVAASAQALEDIGGGGAGRPFSTGGAKLNSPRVYAAGGAAAGAAGGVAAAAAGSGAAVAAAAARAKNAMQWDSGARYDARRQQQAEMRFRAREFEQRITREQVRQHRRERDPAVRAREAELELLRQELLARRERKQVQVAEQQILEERLTDPRVAAEDDLAAFRTRSRLQRTHLPPQEQQQQGGHPDEAGIRHGGGEDEGGEHDHDEEGTIPEEFDFDDYSLDGFEYDDYDEGYDVEYGSSQQPVGPDHDNTPEGLILADMRRELTKQQPFSSHHRTGRPMAVLPGGDSSVLIGTTTATTLVGGMSMPLMATASGATASGAVGGGGLPGETPPAAVAAAGEAGGAVAPPSEAARASGAAADAADLSNTAPAAAAADLLPSDGPPAPTLAAGVESLRTSTHSLRGSQEAAEIMHPPPALMSETPTVLPSTPTSPSMAAGQAAAAAAQGEGAGASAAPLSGEQQLVALTLAAPVARDVSGASGDGGGGDGGGAAHAAAGADSYGTLGGGDAAPSPQHGPTSPQAAVVCLELAPPPAPCAAGDRGEGAITPASDDGGGLVGASMRVQGHGVGGDGSPPVSQLPPAPTLGATVLQPGENQVVLEPHLGGGQAAGVEVKEVVVVGAAGDGSTESTGAGRGGSAGRLGGVAALRLRSPEVLVRVTSSSDGEGEEEEGSEEEGEEETDEEEEDESSEESEEAESVSSSDDEDEEEEEEEDFSEAEEGEVAWDDAQSSSDDSEEEEDEEEDEAATSDDAHDADSDDGGQSDQRQVSPAKELPTTIPPQHVGKQVSTQPPHPHPHPTGPLEKFPNEPQQLPSSPRVPPTSPRPSEPPSTAQPPSQQSALELMDLQAAGPFADPHGAGIAASGTTAAATLATASRTRRRHHHAAGVRTSLGSSLDQRARQQRPRQRQGPALGREQLARSYHDLEQELRVVWNEGDEGGMRRVMDRIWALTLRHREEEEEEEGEGEGRGEVAEESWPAAGGGDGEDAGGLTSAAGVATKVLPSAGTGTADGAGRAAEVAGLTRPGSRGTGSGTGAPRLSTAGGGDGCSSTLRTDATTSGMSLAASLAATTGLQEPPVLPKSVSVPISTQWTAPSGGDNTGAAGANIRPGGHDVTPPRPPWRASLEVPWHHQRASHGLLRLASPPISPINSPPRQPGLPPTLPPLPLSPDRQSAAVMDPASSPERLRRPRHALTPPHPSLSFAGTPPHSGPSLTPRPAPDGPLATDDFAAGSSGARGLGPLRTARPHSGTGAVTCGQDTDDVWYSSPTRPPRPPPGGPGGPSGGGSTLGPGHPGRLGLGPLRADGWPRASSAGNAGVPHHLASALSVPSPPVPLTSSELLVHAPSAVSAAVAAAGWGGAGGSSLSPSRPSSQESTSVQLPPVSPVAPGPEPGPGPGHHHHHRRRAVAASRGGSAGSCGIDTQLWDGLDGPGSAPPMAAAAASSPHGLLMVFSQPAPSLHGAPLLEPQEPPQGPVMSPPGPLHVTPPRTHPHQAHRTGLHTTPSTGGAAVSQGGTALGGTGGSHSARVLGTAGMMDRGGEGDAGPCSDPGGFRALFSMGRSPGGSFSLPPLTVVGAQSSPAAGRAPPGVGASSGAGPMTGSVVVTAAVAGRRYHTGGSSSTGGGGGGSSCSQPPSARGPRVLSYGNVGVPVSSVPMCEDMSEGVSGAGGGEEAWNAVAAAGGVGAAMGPMAAANESTGAEVYGHAYERSTACVSEGAVGSSSGGGGVGGSRRGPRPPLSSDQPSLHDAHHHGACTTLPPLHPAYVQGQIVAGPSNNSSGCGARSVSPAMLGGAVAQGAVRESAAVGGLVDGVGLEGLIADIRRWQVDRSRRRAAGAGARKSVVATGPGSGMQQPGNDKDLL